MEIAISGEVIFVYLHSSTTERAIVLLVVGSSALDGGIDGEHSQKDDGGVAKRDHLEGYLGILWKVVTRWTGL